MISLSEILVARTKKETKWEPIYRVEVVVNSDREEEARKIFSRYGARNITSFSAPPHSPDDTFSRTAHTYDVSGRVGVANMKLELLLAGIAGHKAGNNFVVNPKGPRSRAYDVVSELAGIFGLH